MKFFEAEIKQYQPAEYATFHAAPVYRQNHQPFPPLSERSGTLVSDLPAILPGDRFEPASCRVKGSPFAGKLKDFSGAAVREVSETVNSSGEWAASTGSQRGFILDFGGMRSILRLLRAPGSTMAYVLVLPWQGTDFAMGSLFPAQTGTTPTRKPKSPGVEEVSLRGAESQKIYVQIQGNLTLDQFLDECVLETLVFPANLRASVGDRPPFWTHPGPLQGEVDMTGLAEALTSLAADLAAPLSPKLTLQSDAPGVLEFTGGFSFLSAEKSAPASWAGNAATSLELRAGVPGVFPMHFPEPQDGKTWELRSLKLHAAAALAPWILDAVTPEPASESASLRVDARLSAAQNFRTGPGVELFGVGLLLGSAQGAELSIELQADEGGRPAAAPALASKMLAIAANGGNSGNGANGGGMGNLGNSAWYEASFETPLLLEAGKDFWIVAKAKSGSVRWAVAPALEDAGTAASGRAYAALYAEDGTAWQPYPRMLPVVSAAVAVAAPAAGLRLFRTPRPEENQARVTISHAYGASVVAMSLPVTDEPVEVEWLWPASGRPLLPPAADGRRIDLDIQARSSGGLDVQAATVFFAWKEP
jgi:hypothetical protein